MIEPRAEVVGEDALLELESSYSVGAQLRTSKQGYLLTLESRTSNVFEVSMSLESTTTLLSPWALVPCQNLTNPQKSLDVDP